MKISEILKLDQISEPITQTAFIWVKVFRNDKQNKIATTNQKWQKIAVNYWDVALLYIALLQRSNGTQNKMLNFLVVGWGTAQILTPALVLNQAASKQRTYDFCCIA